MATPFTKGLESITQAEHISPEKTGDNIEAKKVALYAWNGSQWERSGSGLTPSTYDYVEYTNTSDTVDTYVYKVGGSSGTTVATVTIVYTDSTKATISSVTRT